MAKAKAVKGNSRARVSAEALVTAWAKGGTAEEIAARLGIGRNALYSRGRTLRKAGVRLPKLASGRHARIDVAALNAILGG